MSVPALTLSRLGHENDCMLRSRLSSSIWPHLVVVSVFLLACSGPSKDTGAGWLGDTHARPDGSQAGQGRGAASAPLGAQEARARLDKARANGDHRGVIQMADALERAGADVTRADKMAVFAAVDALRAGDLQTLHQEHLASADRATFAAQAVTLRLLLVAVHSGDHERARMWLERLDGGPLPVIAQDDDGTGDSDASADALRARIKAVRARLIRTGRPPVDARVIAVLLPLTGRFSRLGIELQAAAQFANHVEQQRAKLVFLDTEGTEQGARAAVDQAVFAHKAVAIVGPVGDRESLSAARRASELGVPIGVLAPGEAGAGGVFRLWSSPEWEAREAARLAIDLGYDRLAVLAPRDEHGQLATDAFAAAARERGLSLVRRATYDPSSADLEADTKAFLGLDPRTNARLRRHLRRHGYKRGWQTFSPSIDFDLLYIPDSYERAALVVAFLPYFNVEVRTRDAMDIAYLKRKHRGRVPQVVQLLGSSGWHHASLIPRGGPAVEGALVVDIYAGGDVEEFSSEQAARFAEAFDEWAGRQPSALTAQAFDAVTLVLRARAQLAQGAQGGRTRDLRAAMTRALGRVQLADGVCGPARMTPTGVLERRASLLRVDGGTFVLHEY